MRLSLRTQGRPLALVALRPDAGRADRRACRLRVDRRLHETKQQADHPAWPPRPSATGSAVAWPSRTRSRPPLAKADGRPDAGQAGPRRRAVDGRSSRAHGLAERARSGRRPTDGRASSTPTIAVDPSASTSASPSSDTGYDAVDSDATGQGGRRPIEDGPARSRRADGEAGPRSSAIAPIRLRITRRPSQQPRLRRPGRSSPADAYETIYTIQYLDRSCSWRLACVPTVLARALPRAAGSSSPLLRDHRRHRGPRTGPPRQPHARPPARRARRARRAGQLGRGSSSPR